MQWLEESCKKYLDLQDSCKDYIDLQESCKKSIFGESCKFLVIHVFFLNYCSVISVVLLLSSESWIFFVQEVYQSYIVQQPNLSIW